MIWLVFVFFCAVTAGSFETGSNGVIIHHEFCRFVEEAEWVAPLQVEVRSLYTNNPIEPYSKNSFSFNTADEVKAFMTGLSYFCVQEVDRYIVLKMLPLDAEGVAKEYPRALTSRLEGDQVVIQERDILSNLPSQFSVWNRMKEENLVPCDPGDPCFDKEGVQIH